MKLRAIGTGSKFCRHPLTPAAWLVVSGEELTLVGAPWSVVPSLERYGYDVTKLSVILILSPYIDQVAGLVELAYIFKNSKKKPVLAVPSKLMGVLRERVEPEIGFFLDEAFSLKSVTRLLIKEEYFSESIAYVANYLGPSVPSFGLRFENAKIFISGETKLNEDWLYKEMSCDLILHSCRTHTGSTGASPTLDEIIQLPLYLQSKIWLYGYENSTKDVEQPFPMMFLPPGAWVYDSDRRDKLINKERFIRENSKRQL
jgi:hypothetical protein